MQEILVPRVLMGCVCSFVLNSIMFFFLFGVYCALVVRLRPTIRVVLRLYRERTRE